MLVYDPGFFHDLVSAAPSARELSQTSRFYLGDLLTEMIRKSPSLDRPICLILLAPTGPDRPLVLKDAGDTALFLSGWFEEWGQKRGLSTDYFGRLGASAYQELSVRWFRRSPLAPVYGELSADFSVLQASLRDVRGACDRRPRGYAILAAEALRSPPNARGGALRGLARPPGSPKQ